MYCSREALFETLKQKQTNEAGHVCQVLSQKFLFEMCLDLLSYFCIITFSGKIIKIQLKFI